MRFTLLIAAILVVFPVGRASAEKWLLAEENDGNIRKALAPLLPIAIEQAQTFDSDAVLVLERRLYEIDPTEYKECVNYVWWVARGEGEDLTNFVRDYAPGTEVEKVRAFRIRAGALDAKAALRADIEALDEDRIHVQEGDDDTRATNLVVAFDAAQPGDLIAVSIEKKVHDSLSWRTWLLADTYPVSRAELRVKSGWHLSYSVYGHRVARDHVQQEILEKSDGVIRDLRISVDRIDPVVAEPYSPPYWAQSPALAMVWRATSVEVAKGRRIWWYTKHWNQVVSSMARYEEQALASSKQASSVSLASDLSGEEPAAALYRLVRDELLDTSASLYTDDTPTVDDVLEHRTGSPREKAFALAALLGSRGFACQVLWAHDPTDGKFFDEYPSWGQVDIPLVRARWGEHESWYDVGCKTCAPGEIRPELRGERVLGYRPDVVDRSDKLIDQAIDIAYTRRQDIFTVFLNMINQVQWCDWEMTPDDGGAPVGHVLVTRRAADATGVQCTIDVETSGPSRLRREAREQLDATDALETWLSRRYDAIEDVRLVDASEAGADTLRAVLEAELPQLPEPLGDTWVLPAEYVYGTPVVKEWPEPRLSTFYIGETMDYRWVLHVPLPEGWEDARAPANQALGSELLEYHADYEIQDGELVVTRTLRERESEVSDSGNLGIIAEQVRAIHQLETTPVVLQRFGGSR